MPPTKEVFLTGTISKEGIFHARMIINGHVTTLDIEKLCEGYYAVTNSRTGEMTVRKINQAEQPFE